MQKLISITSTLLLTAVVIQMVLSVESDTFEASHEVIRDEYYDVFAEVIDASEESTLSCLNRCAQVGDCSRFRFRAEHKLCTLTKLRREKSGDHTAPLARYFHRKSMPAQQETRVSPQLMCWYTLTHTHERSMNCRN